MTEAYDAWGNVTKVTGDEYLAKQNPFRYRGYYFDEELGLYYLQSRYYDAQVGRFINADDVNVINCSDLNGYLKLKDYARKGAKWICKVNRFAILIDLITLIVPALYTLVCTYKEIKYARKLAASKLGAASKRNMKKKMQKTLKSLVNKIAYYASQKVKAMFVTFISTIVNAIFIILGTTFGSAVAKIIDRYDKKRNNGYCFGF